MNIDIIDIVCMLLVVGELIVAGALSLIVGLWDEEKWIVVLSVGSFLAVSLLTVYSALRPMMKTI